MSTHGPENDAAVYAPSAQAFYDLARVSPEEGGGGAEFQTTRLAAGLAAAGLPTVHIVYPVAERAELPPLLGLVEREPYAGRGGPPAKLREARAIWRALSEADASVYILRGYGLHLIVGYLFGSLRRRSIVMSGSNDIDFMPERRASGLGARAYGRAIAGCDLIVVQTGQQLEVARERFSRSRTDLIPSFAEEAPVSGGGPEAFLWAGRVVPYKRPLAYLDLAERTPASRFWMVGVETSETPAELVAAVRERAAGLDNVELLEPRPRAELLELLGRSIAVVLTSEHEGMPNVFLEAWMRGIPVATLSFDPDGLIGERGLGVSAGDDPGAFAEGVRRLAEDPDARREMGGRGRSYALETHAPAAVSARWAQTIERFLGR